MGMFYLEGPRKQTMRGFTALVVMFTILCSAMFYFSNDRGSQYGILIGGTISLIYFATLYRRALSGKTVPVVTTKTFLVLQAIRGVFTLLVGIVAEIGGDRRSSILLTVGILFFVWSLFDFRSWNKTNHG